MVKSSFDAVMLIHFCLLFPSLLITVIVIVIKPGCKLAEIVIIE